MLVCWRNWAGDTRLVLRNDFSMADTFHEPARLMVALRVLLVLGARCLPHSHSHTCHRKHENKKRSGLTQEA